jgi:bifunctional non-homologous end joining protein LigD
MNCHVSLQAMSQILTSRAKNTAAVLKLPRVQPIAPVRRAKRFDHPERLFDFKYDGFRALCYLQQGRRCRVISRNGNLMSRFADLGEQLAVSLGVNDAILDGEVIGADETGRPQFYDLLRHARAPDYVAFDLLWLNGADLRPLARRETQSHYHHVRAGRKQETQAGKVRKSWKV